MLRARGNNYHDSLVRDCGAASADGGKIADVDDLLNSLASLFAFPVLRCELHLAVGRHSKRGRVNVDAFLEAFAGKDPGTGRESPLRAARDSLSAAMHHKDSELHGKAVFKKLCKLRANDAARADLRVSLLSRDPDLAGHMTKRELQRVLDSHLDLTDPEAALLTENLCFADGTRRSDIDYPLLLLLLLEPVPRSVQVRSCPQRIRTPI